MPPSQRQEKKLEQEMTPSLSPLFSPEGRGGRGGGVDLREEFEKIGADAQVLSPTTPVATPGGEEQEVLPAGEGEWRHVASMVSECAARGYGTYSMRCQSGLLLCGLQGEGAEPGAEALTSSDVNVNTLILFSIYIIS